MTQDERNMLADLANKIAQTPPPPKDADADDFIRRNIGSRPDALYLMTQTVLIQNMALQQAQHQIQDLQQRAAQPVPTGGGGSFLSQGQPSQQQGWQTSQAQPPYSQYSGPQVAPPPSGMSGFLRGAAQTAAGVAAGTLAIQGIESLFTHHSGFGGGSGFFGGGGIGGYAPTEVIKNNYYGNERGGSEREHFNDASDLAPRDDFQDNTGDTQDASDDDDSSALGDDSNYVDDTGSDDNFS